jgi:NAD(P)-dependent dehydrogenase (short-subunit alcohol dehydrogenase family)
MNKAVFITGAQYGTGYGIAEFFAKQGWDIFITSRRGNEAITAAEKLSDTYGVFAKGYECNIGNEQQIIDIVKKEPRTEELTSASDEPVLIDKTSLMNNIESFIINNTDSRPVDVIKIVDNHPVASVDLTQVAMNVVNYLIEEKEVECISVKEILQAMLSPDIQDDDNKTKDNIDNNENCQHQAN